MKRRHHLVIAGTGRAGTSVLVRLLTECGMDTVLSGNPGAGWYPDANAGAESIPLARGHHPYVVKSPWTYQFIRQLLDSPDIQVDEILIPIRRLSDAVASRVVLELRDRQKHVPLLDELEDNWTDWGGAPGGVTYSLEPLDQARILAHSLHRVIEHAEARDVPYRFLSFPRFLEDPDYLHQRIGHLLPPDVTRDRLREIVARVHDPASVRMEREMAPLPGADQPSPELPSLPDLERVVLRREMAELTARVATLSAQVAAQVATQAAAGVPSLQAHLPVDDLDAAPPGLSFGDHVLTDVQLTGWHVMTFIRPNNAHYGMQIAFADTRGKICYRTRTDGVWRRWVDIALTVPFTEP